MLHVGLPHTSLVRHLSVTIFNQYYISISPLIISIFWCISNYNKAFYIISFSVCFLKLLSTEHITLMFARVVMDNLNFVCKTGGVSL